LPILPGDFVIIDYAHIIAQLKETSQQSKLKSTLLLSLNLELHYCSVLHIAILLQNQFVIIMYGWLMFYVSYICCQFTCAKNSWVS